MKTFRSINFIGWLTLISFFLLTGNSFGQEVPVLEWAKSVGSNSNLSPRDMYRDAAGNIYTVGDFWNTADFDPGPGTANLTSLGGYDIFITKFDPSGNYVWAKSLGGARYNFGYGITVDASGNVYTTGWYDGTVDFDPGPGTFNLSANNGAGYYDVFISKLDANGNFVWAKSMGGSGSDEGMGISLDAVGNVYIAGSFAYTVDFDPNAGVTNLVSPDFDAIFVAKYDGNGNLIWAKSIDGKYNQEAYNLALDAAGNVYTTGRLYGTLSDPVDFDPGPGVFNLAPDQNAFFVSKLDANGNFVWAKLIEGEFGQDIAFDGSSNVYVTGKFVGTTDFDPNAGVVNLISAAGPGDIFVLKLTSSGNFVWAKQMGGTGFTTFSGNENRGYGITVDQGGNVLTTGRFAGTGDFDPGPGTFTLSANSTGYTNGFISKLDTNGNFIWAIAYGANSTYESGYTITTDAVGNIYSFGQFQGTCDFDPSACTFNLTGPNGAYVWKLSLGTAIPSPTITSFTPASGSVGTSVTITGTNFSTTPANNVVKFFNGKTATVTASTTTSITAIVPTGVITGPISVTVNCITVQSATNFTVTASTPPTISSFTPSSGPVGATVTITGTNFSTTPANNTVKFNGIGAIVTASTATSITTTVPAGATTGKITVSVGGNTATSATNFTVTAGAIPTITSFTPTSGPVGTTVTIIGTNFSTTPANNTVKFFDGVDSYVVSAVVTASTATSITTTVPSGAFTGKIKVTTAGGSVTSASNFTVTCGSVPTITSFSPLSGIAGTTVTITGTNFSTTPSNNAVDFGGITAIVTASTSTSITTSVPTGPNGLVPISITIACNTVTSSTDFDVTCPPAPTITSFTPGTGAVGAVVTITGSNFSTNPLDNFVDFNGEPAIVTTSTATSITTSVPANAFTGPIIVYVGCDVATSSTDFIVDCGPAPTITSFSPSNGLAGTVITITGANFSTTPANNFVDFNGELAVVTASTATSITTTVPVGAITGPITIVVDCNFVTSTTDFTVGNIITITTQPSDFIACVGQTATFTTAVSGATNIIYQWQFSPDGIVPFIDISNGGGYVNATTATLSVNTTANFGLGRYRCRINGDFASEVITNDDGLFINPISTAPTVVGANRCGVGSVTLTASGGSNGQYKWYTVASGGTAIVGEVNSTYITPSLSATISYFVSLTVSSCESPRTSVTATINPLPTAPTTTGASACLPSATVTLNATGGSVGQYRWYTMATGGTAISGQTGSSFTSPALSATTTYYVSIDNGTCESTRTSVVATLLPCTTPPTIASNTLSTSIGGMAELNLIPLITTINNPLNINSISVTVQPPSGAFASVANGKLLVNYAGISFSGRESVTVRACDTNGNCATQQFEIEVAGDVIVYNALSPGGANPTFVLQYIDIIPETKNNFVTIFDRWQNEVWKGENYNNTSVVFKGVGDGGNDLSTGTYFYKIEFASGKKMRTGFISLKR